ncbi:hypothetical protein QBC46DRAFT_380495 [Diplogelasinospora grovesii]|uniref:Uncharacterized protein n=1 Tax=Diplogelasinospora grovesii TaxID=303347 RepID=A0AAN6S5X0_9PEZI|nr:hypothetical protein QBC46DRAFT_380495 [Diplogelasinospora grovesii]
MRCLSQRQLLLLVHTMTGRDLGSFWILNSTLTTAAVAVYSSELMVRNTFWKSMIYCPASLPLHDDLGNQITVIPG